MVVGGAVVRLVVIGGCVVVCVTIQAGLFSSNLNTVAIPIPVYSLQNLVPFRQDSVPGTIVPAAGPVGGAVVVVLVVVGGAVVTVGAHVGSLCTTISVLKPLKISPTNLILCPVPNGSQNVTSAGGVVVGGAVVVVLVVVVVVSLSVQVGSLARTITTYGHTVVALYRLPLAHQVTSSGGLNVVFVTVAVVI